MRRFVIGDTHGAYYALIQCLKQVSFNYEEDLLIHLGDVCDGYPHTRACIDELLKIKNLVYILGNHDEWALAWMQNGSRENIWMTQGGINTINSYVDGVPKEHIDFLDKAKLYYELDNKLFVHAGLDINQKDMSKQNRDVLLWDRSFINNAYRKHFQKQFKYEPWDEIYLGHTITPNYKSLTPLTMSNVIALDTGAGWGYRLTIMDIDSKEFWQSDPTSFLYPNFSPRG